MEYNYNFALGSILFMGLTTVFYLRQKRMRDIQDTLYTLMLLGGLVAVTFDFLAAWLQSLGMACPLWLLYSVNIFFLLGVQLCLPAALLYSLAVTDAYGRLSRRGRLLTMLPFALVAILILISPLSQAGIFYIDQQHIYQAGATHWALYASATMYIAASCFILGRNYKALSRIKRVLVAILGVLIFCSMVAQLLYPTYLLTTSVTAVALTAMYYFMRAPGEQVDPFTGAFSRNLLPSVLQDLHDKRIPYTLVLYSLANYDDIAYVHGAQLMDGLLPALSDWLKSAFPRDIVVHMNASEFTVLIRRSLDRTEIADLQLKVPASLLVEGAPIPVKLARSVLLQQNERTVEGSLTTMDYLYRQMREERREELFVADGDFQKKCRRLSRLESSLERILAEGQPWLELEPVLISAAPGGPPALLDASMGLSHEELEEITPQELLVVIRQSGHMPWYYQQMMTLVSREAPAFSREVRFCLPLFAGALIQEDMAARLSTWAEAAGVPAERLVFRLQEKDLSNSLQVVKDNISFLDALGFGFRLDDFAQGYTDMSLLTALPIGSIMVGGSLLRQAQASRRSRELLGCVVSILKATGKEVICAGVDSEADAEAAKAAGAALLQGRWRPPAQRPA